MTDCERLLEALSDGKPHDHRELYGLGMVVHSRISDLRRKGYTIHQWRTQPRGAFTYRNRPTYWYRLAPLSDLSEGAGDDHTASSSDSDGAGRSLSGARSSGDLVTESVPPRKPVSSPLPSPTTPAIHAAAAVLPEASPALSLFDVPNEPAWA